MRTRPFIVAVIAVCLACTVPALSGDTKTLKGKVSSIDFIKKTITIGGVVVDAPNTEFGVVPVGLGGKYRLMNSGRPAEVKVGDEVEITYVESAKGERLLRKLNNKSRPSPKPSAKDHNFSLLQACLRGNLEEVSVLLRKGAAENAKDKDGTSALMFAAWQGNIDIIKVLIEKGADVNAKEDGGRTALLYAATKGNLDVVKYLVEKGAEVDAKDTSGATPLICAKTRGHNEVVEYLISRGANDVDISGVVVTTPFRITPEK